MQKRYFMIGVVVLILFLFIGLASSAKAQAPQLSTSVNKLAPSGFLSADGALNLEGNLIGSPIEFTYVPPYLTFDDPNNVKDRLKGRVRNVNPSDYIVACYIFVPNSRGPGQDAWWTKPYEISPITEIKSDRTKPGFRTWECDIVTGGIDQEATIVVAYLMPKAAVPPILLGAPILPPILDNYPRALATRKIIPPNTTITNHPSNPSNSDTATFEFASNEYYSTFQCSLDGVAFTACANPKQYTGLKSGSHNFRVYAINYWGMKDTTPAVFTWTVAK